MLLDADDEYLPDAVEKMVRSAQKYDAQAMFAEFYLTTLVKSRNVLFRKEYIQGRVRIDVPYKACVGVFKLID